MTMSSDEDCFCDRLEQLVGVAIEDYTSRFLIRTDYDPIRETEYYRCRRCQTGWALEKDPSTGHIMLRRLSPDTLA